MRKDPTFELNLQNPQKLLAVEGDQNPKLVLKPAKERERQNAQKLPFSEILGV